MAARILIVEDEFLVGVQLEEDLLAAGHAIVGPCTTLEEAIATARRESFDLALLDVNLNGVRVYPLADELICRGVPVILVSGYQRSDLPSRFRDTPQIAKPYDPTTLAGAIRAAVGD